MNHEEELDESGPSPAWTPFVRRCANGELRVNFLEHRSDIDPEAALRAAVAEFLETPEGKEAVEAEDGYFDWGHAFLYVPEELFEKHGVRVLPTLTEEIVVNDEEHFVQPAG